MRDAVIKHAIREWDGVPAGVTHRVLVEAAKELLAQRARMEAWARQLETDTLAGGSGVGPFIAAELRNRMKGG